MSRSRRPIAGAAAGLVLAMALGGCSGSIKAPDIGPVTGPVAQKGIVTPDDMPDGWNASPADDANGAKPAYTPAGCAAVGERPAGTARLASGSYQRGGTLAAAVVETIYRPKGQTPAQEVTRLRALVTECASYRFRRGDTKGYAVSVEPLKVKKQATDTLGVRTSISGSMTTVSDAIIWVAAGDVVVRFDSITAGDGLTQKDLEKLVKTSLSRLKK